jgi:hypothetical protein
MYTLGQQPLIGQPDRPAVLDEQRQVLGVVRFQFVQEFAQGQDVLGAQGGLGGH